jgi:hypothetical protein
MARVQGVMTTAATTTTTTETTTMTQTLLLEQAVGAMTGVPMAPCLATGEGAPPAAALTQAQTP